MQLIVSSGDLENKRERLETLKNSFETQIRDFESLAKNLDSMWDGQARKQYAQAIKTDITKLNLLLKLIGEFISVLSKIIILYKDMEKKNVATASS